MIAGKPLTPRMLLWPPRILDGVIQPGEAHLWSWSFSSQLPLEDDLRILNDDERARTVRFRFPADQVRYSASHAKMRRILGSYLGRGPESVVFREGSGGKPELNLKPTDPPLRFNLSHSKTIGLLAVALDRKVGVDAEDIRPIETGVAERHFSPAELSALAKLSGPEWLNGFYRCWTRKEAVLKAEGVGLRIPLDSFDVSLSAREPAILLAARPESRLTADWKLYHLAPAEGVMAAVAVEAPAARIIESSLAE